MIDIVLLDCKSGYKLGRLVVVLAFVPAACGYLFRWLCIVLPAVLVFLFFVIRHRGKLVLGFGWS